jgi:aminoglycoside phosphotransferase (APT) family kinase protein
VNAELDAWNTGTKPVAASMRFDVAALHGLAAAHLPGFAGPLAVEQFKGGQSNPTYKLLTPGHAYVMRAKPGPVAKLLPSAHAVEREFRVMRALHGSGVPVARMHAAVRGRVGHRPRLLRHGVRRRPRAVGPVAARHDAAERGAIYDEMNRVIAALHSVDVAGGGAGRLRQARQLLRAPDRPLEQAVPGLETPNPSRPWTG